MGQLKTSIIILAYKEPEKFKRMFETLIQNTSQKRTPYEIIVIDNDCDGKKDCNLELCWKGYELHELDEYYKELKLNLAHQLQ